MPRALLKWCYGNIEVTVVGCVEYNNNGYLACCSGLNSEYDDRFQAPSDVKGKEATYCPVNTPYLLPAPGNKVTYITPHMYKTEYMNIGSERPLTV